MIGNDIVDLNTMQSNWNRPRFLTKVFSDREQHIIANSENKHQTMWFLWSMKEAAYKIYVQQYNERFLNPIKLVCFLSSPTAGYVTINNETYFTTSVISKNYVYTIATLLNHKNYTSVFTKGEYESYFAQSNSLKVQCLDAISKTINLKREELEIIKTKLGVPQLYHKNSKIPITMSLTHCGPYSSYVYAVPEF